MRKQALMTDRHNQEMEKLKNIYSSQVASVKANVATMRASSETGINDLIENTTLEAQEACRRDFEGHVQQLEAEIKRLAIRARDGELTVDEMQGGTFTITNGGVFGSMLSTPIINPPQSAILGMHNIVERPVAIDGKVEIRPIMYVALSYDHRIVDGKESVGFLYMIKEMIENPERMLFGGKTPTEVLLGL